MADRQVMYRVKDAMEGEDLSIIFQEIKDDLSQQILRTRPGEKEAREELYWQSYGLTLLERKMQEYVNDLTKENE